MNEEWQKLDAETQIAVRAVIDRARKEQAHIAEPFRDGEIYAYPHGSGGIAWGVNGRPDGFNIARGVME